MLNQSVTMLRGESSSLWPGFLQWLNPSPAPTPAPAGGTDETGVVTDPANELAPADQPAVPWYKKPWMKVTVGVLSFGAIGYFGYKFVQLARE